MDLENVIACGLLLTCIVPILVRRNRIAGTTLIAPSRWTAFTLFCVSAVLACEARITTDSTRDALQYWAGTSSLCPLMAILGAKRPQNVGWQFIVGTLWLVLILPVGEMFVLWEGGELDVGPMRSWLLVILLLVGFTNYMLTRFALASSLATLGQALMLWPYLPLIGSTESNFAYGALFLAASMLLFFWQTRKATDSGGWNYVWTEFRNAFGLVWGLRVMERVNETARLCEWDHELTWFGFASTTTTEDSEAKKRKQVERAMRTTLRRFVSPAWIEQKHGSLEASTSDC